MVNWSFILCNCDGYIRNSKLHVKDIRWNRIAICVSEINERGESNRQLNMCL